MIDMDQQLIAVMARYEDMKRRMNEIMDEMREIVDDVSRLGARAVKESPHMAGPVKLLVEQLRALSDTMRKVGDD